MTVYKIRLILTEVTEHFPPLPPAPRVIGTRVLATLDNSSDAARMWADVQELVGEEIIEGLMQD